MKLLRSLGLFDKEYVDVGGCNIQSYKLTAKLFEKYLKQTIQDQAIIYVEAIKGGRYYKFKSHLLGGERYSATALYTALMYTRTIELALKGFIKSGVRPLEVLSSLYSEYLGFLKGKGVLIEIEENLKG